MFQGKAAVQTIPLRSSLGIFSERSDNSDVVDSDVEKSYRLVDWTDWSSRVLYSEVGTLKLALENAGFRLPRTRSE